jgi:hypothetical protein
VCVYALPKCKGLGHVWPRAIRLCVSFLDYFHAAALIKNHIKPFHSDHPARSLQNLQTLATTPFLSFSFLSLSLSQHKDYTEALHVDNTSRSLLCPTLRTELASASNSPRATAQPPGTPTALVKSVCPYMFLNRQAYASAWRPR